MATSQKPEPEDLIKIENQICFPLYTASRLMVQLYKPYLDPIGLTYPQYLVMMVLWEKEGLNVKQIGDILLLDSATLTQILKNLEKMELITRERVKGDARTVMNRPTKKGIALKKKALAVPQGLSCHFEGSASDVMSLKPMLLKLISVINDALERVEKAPADR